MSYSDPFRKSRRRGPRPLVRDILPPERGDTEVPIAPPPRPRRLPPPPEEPTIAKGLPPAARAPLAPLPAELELPVRTWEPEAAKRRRRGLKLSLAGGGAVLLLGFSLPLVAFPLFAVTITPKVAETDIPALTMEATTAISAPDAAARRVPGVLVTIEAEDTREYPTSGRKYLEERAAGTVTIVNAHSSSPQTLVAGTRFRAPGNEIFRLTRTTVVPGARIEEGKIVPQSTSAGVVAAEPGEAYNLGPSEFRIPGFFGSPKYDGFTAKSQEPFHGGFRGEAAVVSVEDLKNAEEEITAALVKRLERELEARIPAGGNFVALPGSLQTLVTQLGRPPVGERRDSFRLSVNGRGRMLLMGEAHLHELFGALLFPSDSLATLTRKQPKLSFSRVRLDADAGRMTFGVEGRVTYYRKTPAEEIAGVMRASTPRKIEAYLRGREEIAAFRIKKFPAWLWFIPKRAGAIRVTVEEPRG